MHIETIRIQDGRVRNITYHDERYRRTQRAVYGVASHRSLRQHIVVPDHLKTQRVKCRISYTDSIQSIEYEPYTVRKCLSLQLVSADGIDYTHKAADRNALTALYTQRGPCDDILMVRDGLLTDTYYGNVALLQNGRYYTPATPLLEGTMRAYLLATGQVHIRDIRPQDLDQYAKVIVYNAMLPFGEVEVPIEQVYALK